MKPRASKGILAGALLVLVAVVATQGAVADSATGPIAAASKKKCRKALWKCAPKRYHLSVTDRVGPGPQNGSSLMENWTAEVDLVRVARSIGKVDYGAEDGTVKVSGSYEATCPDGSTTTARIEPQTIAVPHGPGYPFLGDFGVEFSLIGSGKNTYGGPLGDSAGGSNLFVTTVISCLGSFQEELLTPRGMFGKGKPGKALKGSDVFSDLFTRHNFSWELTPKK